MYLEREELCIFHFRTDGTGEDFGELCEIRRERQASGIVLQAP